MTSIFYNSSSNNHSPYPSDHNEDHLKNHQFLSPNYQASSSSNSLTTHLFLNSNDQNGIFNRKLQPPQHKHMGDNFGSQPYNDHQIENNKGKGVEFSTWNKNGINNMNIDLNQVKWMSSKTRVMLKMKKSGHVNPKSYSPITGEVKKLKDHKLSTSPMEETYNSSNSSSNNNIPIRVCSDCNTTKTPLWRSGPRGPKSLCNACGIRQRKARRAMAAAENSNSNVFIDQSIMRPLKVTKTQHKDHKKPYKGQVTKQKKRQYSKQITTITPPSPSYSPARKNCVEEFLVSLSKNLTFYHVFPQDEKEAAILLMALSCGYAHET
ncbi:hypothetical protein L1987_50158 [Smallanthus sonchifolius]|uniref:Uncharacterized protein n=1 Tax=Smallanthus sonchifolius TaxID=185202 RepID=A0ACB9FWP9_9ASTR|nr:hypothetical protein L1987_50158 [Smallanthus sonchifolius]